MSLPASTTSSVAAGAGERRRRLEELFAAYGSTVYAYARRRGSATDAEDVVSDTFLVAWRRLDDVPSSPLPWLLTVARGALANRRRASTRQEALRLRLATTRPADANATGTPSDGLAGPIAGALATLPAAEYDALTLIAWEGLTPDEVSTVLGCSRAAVYLRISRARRRLRRTLGDLDHYLEGPHDDDD